MKRKRRSGTTITRSLERTFHKKTATNNRPNQPSKKFRRLRYVILSAIIIIFLSGFFFILTGKNPLLIQSHQKFSAFFLENRDISFLGHAQQIDIRFILQQGYFEFFSDSGTNHLSYQNKLVTETPSRFRCKY